MAQPRQYKRKPLRVAVCRKCRLFYKSGARGRCTACDRPLLPTVIFNGKGRVLDA